MNSVTGSASPGSTATVLSPFTPTYTTGLWYDRRSASGLNIGQGASANGASAPITPNLTAYVPLFCHKAVTIDQIGVMNGASAATAGATVRLGLFSNSAQNLPAARLYDWAAISPTTASTFYSAAASGTIPAGWSWLAFAINSVSSIGSIVSLYFTQTLYPLTGTAAAQMTPSFAQNGSGVFGYTEIGSGTLNATVGTLTPLYPGGALNYTPNAWFRVAS